MADTQGETPTDDPRGSDDSSAAGRSDVGGAGDPHEDVQRLRAELSRVNSESASRRHALSSAEAELEKLKKRLATIDEKAAAEQGKFKELYEKTKTEFDSFRERASRVILDQEVRVHLGSMGIPAPVRPLVSAALDLSDVAVSDSFSITGDVEGIIKAKVDELRPHLNLPTPKEPKKEQDDGEARQRHALSETYPGAFGGRLMNPPGLIQPGQVKPVTIGETPTDRQPEPAKPRLENMGGSLVDALRKEHGTPNELPPVD